MYLGTLENTQEGNNTYSLTNSAALVKIYSTKLKARIVSYLEIGFYFSKQMIELVY